MSEYKKAKQDLKKATAETNKWQKKVKKGELGEHNKYLLHLKINLMYLQRDPSCVCYILNATNHPVIKSLETISHLYHCFVEENFFQHSELELLCLQWLHFRVMPRDLIVTK